MKHRMRLRVFMVLMYSVVVAALVVPVFYIQASQRRGYVLIECGAVLLAIAVMCLVEWASGGEQ